jgi:Holliday junction resolvase RusA-like endonuclease
MTRSFEQLEHRFVVPGKAISFRSPTAKAYKRRVAREARRVLRRPSKAKVFELRLDYFHTSERRCDMDNVAKCVLDALNLVAYSDDRLVKLQSARAHDLRHVVRLHGGPVDLIKPLRQHDEYVFVRLREAGEQ